MNEQLQQEIDALEAQKQIFSDDMEKIAGDETRKSTYDALAAELANVDKKLDAKKAQQNEVQTEVETSQSAMEESLAQIDIGDGTYASIYDYTTTPEAGDMLIAYINSKLAEITAQATIQRQAYQIELQETNDKYTALLADNYQKTIDLADVTAKRDAAVKETEDANAKIAQLEKESEDLRSNMVKPANTNINANLKELAEKAKAARQKIYNLRWKDESNRNKYLANDAATGDEIEFSFLSLGKYNVIDEDEALQFRNGADAAEETPQPVDEDPVPDRPLDTDIAPPETPFQDDAADVPAVPGQPANGAVETEARGIEERVSELEAIVNAIRVKVGV